jgi:hypothetical protein
VYVCLKHVRTSVKFLDTEKQVNALDVTPDKQLIAAAGKELLSNVYLAFLYLIVLFLILSVCMQFSQN